MCNHGFWTGLVLLWVALSTGAEEQAISSYINPAQALTAVQKTLTLVAV